ncbi:MAG: hypothetical protein ACXVFV_05355 [Mycobacteriales bacterium]
MLYADGLLGLALLVLWVYSLFDVITTPAEQVRNLPKPAWVVLVLLLGELAIGPVLWRLAGRPRAGVAVARLPRPAPRPEPGAGPEDDASFLEGLRARAEQQRLRAAEQERRRREGEPPTA